MISIILTGLCIYLASQHRKNDNTTAYYVTLFCAVIFGLSIFY